MAKTIKFEFERKNYVLEFTRETVKQMEAAGFQLSFAKTKPVTFADTLFAGAFLAHHRSVANQDELLQKMFTKLGRREKLIEKLTDMYLEPALSLYDESENSDDEGNIEWGEAD